VNIRIKNTLRKRRLPSAAYGKKLTQLLLSLGLPDAELSVMFIGDRAMRALNHKWRGKDRTTDVLSFPLREGRFPHIQPEMLGDIVISVPVAVRQADEAGHSLTVEIERLLVHGLVHLLGYDHDGPPGCASNDADGAETPEEACRMKPKNWVQRANVAIEGIIYAVKTQRHMRYHLFAALAALILGLVLNISRAN